KLFAKDTRYIVAFLRINLFSLRCSGDIYPVPAIVFRVTNVVSLALFKQRFFVGFEFVQCICAFWSEAMQKLPPRQRSDFVIRNDKNWRGEKLSRLHQIPR